MAGMRNGHVFGTFFCAQGVLYDVCCANSALYFLVVMHTWVYTVLEGCGTCTFSLTQCFEASIIIQISMVDSDAGCSMKWRRYMCSSADAPFGSRRPWRSLNFWTAKYSWQTVLSPIGIYGAMLFAYWGATYVPSGWLSVIWGTSPVFTGILAKRYLGESLSWYRLFGLLLSLAGLAVIFLHSGEIGERAWLGVLLVVGGVLVQSGTAVWLKHLDAKEHGLMMTATGLLFSLPLFALTWWLFDGEVPETIPLRAGLSIVYLAVFGSLLGFSLYYFLINQIEASKLALVTLVTPVTALLIGRFLNDEPLTLTVYLGTGLILLGLASYQWGRWLLQWITRTPS